MTNDEARERMLAALAAAGVNGIDTDDPAFDGDYQALTTALCELHGDGIARQCAGWWRLSDEELARRILKALGVDEGRTRWRVDAVVSVLRGAS